MKRVLLDQGLSPLVAELLRKDGWDAAHVAEIGMSTSTDAEILRVAANQGRVCVTLDHDFHAHQAVASAINPSVVLLRAEGLTASAVKDLLVVVWRRIESEIEGGIAVSASPKRIRVRRLPLREREG